MVTWKEAAAKAGKGLWSAFPMILGTMLLVSLIATLVPPSLYLRAFGKSVLLNSLVGTLAGSISAGNPITSYILGGELLEQGISLVTVTAFIVAWVTVGVIQLPAESTILGKRFATLRNLSSFVLAIIVGLLTVAVLGVL